LQAFDRSGRPLPASGALLEEIDDVPGLSSFEAPLPTGATRFELTLGGAVVASRAASRPPRVRVIAPRPGARAPRDLRVRWAASDPDGDRLQAVVQFSPGDAPFRTVFVGPSTGALTIPAARLQATQRGRVRVTVNDSFTAATAVSGPFRAEGVAPSVSITTPGPRSAATAGGPTLLVGEGTDDSGRTLGGRSLTWFAGERRLGRGATLRASLPAGRVRLRLVARDRQGRTSTAQRSVQVQPVPLEIQRLDAPATVPRRARTLTVAIATSTASRLRIGGRTFRVGPPLRRVTAPLPRRPASGLLRVPLRVTADGPAQPPITRDLLIYRR
jgi:hypothetical protein